MFSEETLLMLEFPIILEQLADYTRCEDARLRALALHPFQMPNPLALATQKTRSARRIFDAMGKAPISTMEGLTLLQKRIELGEILSLGELSAVGSFLHHCRLLRKYMERAVTIDALVGSYGLSIQPLEELREEIERCIRSDQVLDSASPLLRTLRQKQEGIAAKIKEKLGSLLRAHPQYFQEAYYVQRGARYALSVKKEYRSQIKGTVLDASSSGATVFIEPQSVSALQEQLDYCHIEEENEILRILATLSAQVASYASTITANMQGMAEIDFLFACAQLGASMNGVCANPTAKRALSLEEARHPLLGPQTVPLTVHLGSTRALVITGPNTGGKTVAIKTVGLLTLMALSGLQVPAREATIPLFDGVYCDIGDGQSIAQSLSTFSSHVKRVVGILQNATGKSLVLLDELGAGTDPQEGMGLAVAVLTELGRRSCLLVATSHYPEIKAFAGKTPGFQNGRMTFDPSTLSPRYQLEMGQAGESCALHIAKRLGVPDHILSQAWQAAYPDGHMEDARQFLQEETPPDEPIAIEEDMPVVEEPIAKKVPVGAQYQLGDSVFVSSMGRSGIVCQTRNARGEIGVRIQEMNFMVNEKRLKPYIPKEQLYPGEEYDLSIVLNTWDERKAMRDVRKGKKGAQVVVSPERNPT